MSELSPGTAEAKDMQLAAAIWQGKKKMGAQASALRYRRQEVRMGPRRGPGRQATVFRNP